MSRYVIDNVDNGFANSLNEIEKQCLVKKNLMSVFGGDTIENHLEESTKGS